MSRSFHALREGSGEGLLKLAKEHFPPVYRYVADYCYREKMYEDSAYFYYLYWRRPTNFCCCMRTFEYEDTLREIEIPAAKRFCESLVNAGRYEEVYEFILYFCGLFRARYLLRKEMVAMRNEIEQQVLAKGEKFSERSEAMVRKLTLEYGYFVIPDFEQRYRTELAKICADE
ncbi:MAG: hypothetical protein LUD52_00585 [Opitutae bacterium]|nr:hypothetical protein [Opitutae bacterium]